MSYRISSNLTILLKLIIPTLVLVFFGSFTLAFFVADPADTPVLYIPLFKWIFLSGFILSAMILYVTFIRLLRVEVDEESMYATNYFKTVRYPLEAIDTIKAYNLIFTQLFRVRLKTKGTFGRSIPFIAARTRLNDYLADHPTFAEWFLNKQKP